MGVFVIGVLVFNVVGIGNGVRYGVLLKGSEVIGNFSKVDIIVFDKIGIFIIGYFVLRYEVYFELDKIEIIFYIYSIEK